jgi:DNA processing protein
VRRRVMGEGRIHETVLSLMLAGDFPRKRMIRILRELDAARGTETGTGLFDRLPSVAVPGGDGPSGKQGTARRLLEDLRDRGIGVVCLADASYPRLLKEIDDPPPLLFFRGGVPDWGLGAVAIVGARKASLGGMRLAARLAGELARAGVVVVSGMARGIDTAAHEGALEAGGKTVAVLGSGIDVAYPPENAGLMARIAGSGAVVSELTPGSEPLRHNFPRRNRIISGLSVGTVVVEAGEKSGALITATCAVEQNRSVFAVPGSPGFIGSKGTNSLLRQGATLVESVDDVLAEIAPQLEPSVSGECDLRSPVRLGADEGRVLGLLSSAPAHVDELCRTLEMAPGEAMGVLFALEARGLVRSMPGKFYVRTENA